MKNLFGLAAGVCALFVIAPVYASMIQVGPPIIQEDPLEAPLVFTFEGVCAEDDCAFSRGTLTNYGTEVDLDHFVSFVYESNLTSFTITNDTATGAMGTLSNLPGANFVQITGGSIGDVPTFSPFEDGSFTFISRTNGTWDVFKNLINFDTGPDHVWDGPDTTGDVPEPATWAMMVGGFGLVGGALRRRAKVAVRFG